MPQVVVAYDGVLDRHPVAETEHEGHRGAGHGPAGGLRRDRHHDVRIRRGVHIDHVVTHARPRDKRQASAPGKGVPRVGLAHGDHRVEILELIRRDGPPVLFEEGMEDPGFVQQIDAEIVEHDSTVRTPQVGDQGYAEIIGHGTGFQVNSWVGTGTGTSEQDLGRRNRNRNVRTGSGTWTWR